MCECVYFKMKGDFIMKDESKQINPILERYLIGVGIALFVILIFTL